MGAARARGTREERIQQAMEGRLTKPENSNIPLEVKYYFWSRGYTEIVKKHFKGMGNG